MKFNLELGSLKFSVGRTPAAVADPAASPEIKRLQTSGSKPQSSLKRMYAAAKVDRTTADWTASRTSENAEIHTSRLLATARSRQQARDNPYAAGALFLFENNVIGHLGIQLEMRVQDSPKLQDKVANDLIETAWSEALEPENCTVSRSLGGVELQMLAADSIIRDGGILFRKHIGFANKCGFALESIEIDRLHHDYNRPGADGVNEIQFGIEYDRFRAPLFYHILTRHPGDMFSTQGRVFRERIPADQIIACWDIRRRAEQLVTMPRFSHIVEFLKHVEELKRSELIAARHDAGKMGFLEKQFPESYTGDGKDAENNTISQLEPGQIEELPMGMSFKQIDTKHPNTAMPDFIKGELRGTATGTGVGYHPLANDYSDVNYTSLRHARQHETEEYKKIQHVLLIPHLMRAWFRAWLPCAILAGRVRLPIAKLEKFQKSDTWMPRAWEPVDPLKDAQAERMALEDKKISLSQVIRESGSDIETVFARIQADEVLAKQYGIKMDFAKNPAQTAPDGGPPPKVPSPES